MYSKVYSLMQHSARLCETLFCYRQRELVVKIVCLQSFENQNERIH